MPDQIELRNPLFPDKDLIFEWISNPALRKMIGTRGVPTKETHAVWFENKLKDSENVFKIITANSIPVGIAGTNEIDKCEKTANIYIYLGDESYRKKGISMQALNLLIDILFREYGMQKITANIFSYNQPSICFFKKAGFVCERTEKDKIVLDGEYYDQFIYAYEKE